MCYISAVTFAFMCIYWDQLINNRNQLSTLTQHTNTVMKVFIGRECFTRSIQE